MARMSVEEVYEKNLEAIRHAIINHSERCLKSPLEVWIHPIELERMGLDTEDPDLVVMNVPVVPNRSVGTGIVRVMCADDMKGLNASEHSELAHV